MSSPRTTRLLAGIAGALVLTCAPASAEPHRWSLSISPAVTWLQPAGSYQPIGPDNDWSFAIRATLAREGIPLALRLEAQSLGGDGQTFPDSLASVHGVPVGFPVDVSVYNRETFWTAVLEWNPRADRSGPYAFAGAGGFRLSGTVLGTEVDMVLPDAPVLPANRVHLCVLGGAGARVVAGRNHNHSLFAEAAWLHSGPANWVATPAARSDLGHTIFPVRRSAVDAVLITAGYAFAIRWGGPHVSHPPEARGWRRFLPKRSGSK